MVHTAVTVYLSISSYAVQVGDDTSIRIIVLMVEGEKNPAVPGSTNIPSHPPSACPWISGTSVDSTVDRLMTASWSLYLEW